MKRFNINLPDELYEKLRKEAFEKKVSMNKLVLDALGVTAPSTSVKVLKKKIIKSEQEADKFYSKGEAEIKRIPFKG